jgi:CBS domain containing-hemolysin-like protein
VLEELIGEIQDEYDQESPKIKAQADGRLLVDAALTLDAMEQGLGMIDDTAKARRWRRSVAW